MGMYRTVIATLPCGGCRQREEWEVQFKTGADALQVYAATERAPDDGVLETGVVYSGCGDRYCGACLYRLRLAQREILSAFVRYQMNRGRLELTRVGRSERLSLADVLGLVKALPVYLDLSEGLRALDGHHLVWWDGQVVAAPTGWRRRINDDGAELLEKAWRRSLAAGCRKRGWPSWDNFRNFCVTLTKARRFRVTESPKPVPTPRVVTERELKVWTEVFEPETGRRRMTSRKREQT